MGNTWRKWKYLKKSQANKRSQAVVNMDSLGFETVTSGIASASRNCFNKRNATK